MMKMSIWREFLPASKCSIRGDPEGTVYREEKRHTNMTIQTYVCVASICNYDLPFYLRSNIYILKIL